MKSILNVIKFNLKSQKTLLIIEACIILFFTIMGLKTWFFDIGIPKGLSSILPTVAVMIVVNFVIAIVKFSMQLSTEEGRLLHLVPMKGWQFIIAKYLEFIIIQLVVVILGIVSCIILRGGATEVFITGIAEAFGMLVAYMMITAFIIITASYFEKVWICIIATIAGCMLYNFGGFIIEILVFNNIPSVYVVINEYIRISIIDSAAAIVCFVGLIAIAAHHFDKKLDIV